MLGNAQPSEHRTYLSEAMTRSEQLLSLGGRQLFPVSITSSRKAVARREGDCEAQCSLAYTLTSSQPWLLSSLPYSPLTCHLAFMCWCWVQATDEMALLPLKAFSLPHLSYSPPKPFSSPSPRTESLLTTTSFFHLKRWGLNYMRKELGYTLGFVPGSIIVLLLSNYC